MEAIRYYDRHSRSESAESLQGLGLLRALAVAPTLYLFGGYRIEKTPGIFGDDYALYLRKQTVATGKRALNLARAIDPEQRWSPTKEGVTDIQMEDGTYQPDYADFNYAMDIHGRPYPLPAKATYTTHRD